MRFLILFFILTLAYNCSNAQQTNNTNHTVDPKAKELNDSAVTPIFHNQNYETAIALLDKALQIDSNYLTALANKCGYELQLHEYDKAIITAKRMIKIKPEDPTNFVSTGLAYFLYGDSVSSEKYFKKAGTIYNSILDTMSKTNENYKFELLNKAVNSIFSGDAQKGNDILKGLTDNTNNEIEKELYTEYINKSREEIIDEIFNGKQDSSTTTTIFESPQLDNDTIQYYTKRNIKRHHIVNGFYLLKEIFKKRRGIQLQDTGKYYYVAKNVMMPFKNLDTVFKKYNQHQKKYLLEFYFNKAGAKQLQHLTEECVNQPLGLFINNKLIAAPNVNGPIDSGKLELSGLFTEGEVDKIVKRLN